jgi:hypothetical protein
MNKLAIAALIAATLPVSARAEIPVFPTVGVYSPMRNWDKAASWTLPNRPRGYLAIISAALRFDPAISDYITCTLPGMTGAAGDEKVRFSVSFSETKTVTFTGFVAGTSLALNCISEGQKLKPVALEASLVAVSVDQAVRR